MEINEIEEGELSSVTGKEEKPIAQPSNATDATTKTVDPNNDGVEIIAEDDKITWPTANDLNTRLRRVITSYQRNIHKKDEIKTPTTLPHNQHIKIPQEIKIGNQGTNTMEPPMNLQSWDLQKLAMYLLVS